eukprot:TRINITY_DN14331_c0_g2_i2.p1 TRINITY_DN14331_c0_g2~~TRINITY_DN14331_c0_g2_i2.p1  ORF type:complete len:166 (+),score=34.33 TRINITY_DN14331_c0_g2_i2:55-552(+)
MHPPEPVTRMASIRISKSIYFLLSIMLITQSATEYVTPIESIEDIGEKDSSSSEDLYLLQNAVTRVRAAGTLAASEERLQAKDAGKSDSKDKDANHPKEDGPSFLDKVFETAEANVQQHSKEAEHKEQLSSSFLQDVLAAAAHGGDNSEFDSRAARLAARARNKR